MASSYFLAMDAADAKIVEGSRVMSDLKIGKFRGYSDVVDRGRIKIDIDPSAAAYDLSPDSVASSTGVALSRTVSDPSAGVASPISAGVA